MLTFVVVGSKPGKAIPQHVLDAFGRSDVPELFFEPEAHTSWSDDTGGILFAGWQAAADVFGIGSHWHSGEGGLTAFSGRPFPADGPWDEGEPWSSQLAARLRQRPLERSLEDLRGVYSAVSLGLGGSGCVVSDPLGVGVLYVGESDELLVVSNRAGLAARALTPDGQDPARDPVGVAWLMYCGYIVGNATGFKGVRTLDEGSLVHFDRARGPEVRGWSEAPWLFDEDAGRDDLVEFVRHDLGLALRAAVAVPASPRVADITGGKDSRMVLAGLLAEGLTEDIGFQTYGAPSSPDVLVGGEVARRFGLRHSAEDPGSLSPSDFEHRLRVHAMRTSGMLGAWDLKGPTRSLERLHVSGGCGEILRTNYPDYRDLASTDQLLGAFRAGMRFDALELLKPDLRAEFDDQTTGSLLAGPSGSEDPLDLIDVFYLRNRLRRWFGTDQETDCSNRIFPLYSLAGVRAGFAIGAVQRRNDYIPFHVIRRCAPELGKLPLANGAWSEVLLEGVSDADEYRSSPVTPTREAAHPPQRPWQAERLRDNTEVFRELLGLDPGHPMFEVVDRDAMVAAVEGARDLSFHGQIALYGAVTAAIWLSGGEADWRVPPGTVAW